MKKIDLSLSNFTKGISMMRCTKCHQPLELKNDTLICGNNHQYQVNKKGTVNMALGRDMTISKYYDRDLFLARKYVQEHGFFDLLASTLVEEIPANQIVLDAGTGDGYFTDNLTSQTLNFGIDLSKEAIHEAGNRQVKNTCYIVADLANLPNADHSIDCIINVLSPANYNEFNRVLKNNGQVIKVVPTKNYLREIREYYNINSDYDNSKVVDLFRQSFNEVTCKTLTYQVEMNEQLLRSVLVMTPLTKHNNFDELPPISLMTCEFELLIGYAY